MTADPWRHWFPGETLAKRAQVRGQPGPPACHRGTVHFAQPLLRPGYCGFQKGRAIRVRNLCVPWGMGRAFRPLLQKQPVSPRTAGLHTLDAPLSRAYFPPASPHSADKWDTHVVTHRAGGVSAAHVAIPRTSTTPPWKDGDRWQVAAAWSRPACSGVGPESPARPAVRQCARSPKLPVV